MTAPHDDHHPAPASPEPSEPGRPTAPEHQGPNVTEELGVEPTGIPSSTDEPDRRQDLHGEGVTADGAETATALGDEPDAAGGPRGPGGPLHPDAEVATALGDEPDAAGFGGPPPGGADVWPTDEALDAVDLDDTGWTRRGLEAILLVADEPVPATTLAELVGARLTQVESMLIDLAGEYAAQGRGFVLRAVAGGWRLYTHPSARDVVEAYLRAGTQSRLTRAALETLAVVAYRQPVTRHQVAAVRGVNVDGVFRTLTTRGLIHEVGHEEGPGQAALYGTTPAFLEQLGLNSLDQLPPIKDYLPEGVDLMELLEQM
jgi:segregation and condensation protein B